MQQPEPVPVEQGLGLLLVHLFINSLQGIEYELQLQGLIQEIRTCNGDPVKHLGGGLCGHNDGMVTQVLCRSKTFRGNRGRNNLFQLKQLQKMSNLGML